MHKANFDEGNNT